MPKNHGAKQQKKVAKQRAKREKERSRLIQRTTDDPTVRLRNAGKWPVVQALVAKHLWRDGIGYAVLARQVSEGHLICAVFLVDVFCLGVKNTFWEAVTPGSLEDLVEKLEQELEPVTPECLVKLVEGSVEFAASFGFTPHPDYRHSRLLFEGIDPSACARELSFGRDGKPFYFRGPYESLAQARVISQRVIAAGGHYLVGSTDPTFMEADFETEDEEYDPLADPDDPRFAD